MARQRRTRRNKGHVRERSPGKWEIRVTVGKDARTGKWKIATATIEGDREAAEAELRRMCQAHRQGVDIHASKITLGEYLKLWLAHIKPNVSPATHERYTDLCLKNIVPLLGAVTLSKLKSVQISTAYATALASGRRDGKGGLSPRTVHHMHRVLSSALRQAVRWEMLAKNPADLEKKDRPKVERKRMTTYDTDEAVTALETLRPTRIFIPIVLGMTCGLRRGEICALRWRDIDLDQGQIAVVLTTEQTDEGGCREKELKNTRCRTVSLSAFIIRELRSHKAKQAEELLKLGIRQGADHHVVAREDGEPLQPHSMTNGWRRLIGTKKLKRIRFHDTRHSHAWHMLKENVHPKIVQERLGHSSISITMDIYSHLMPNMQQEAADRVDSALTEALQKRAASQKDSQ